MRRNLSGPHRAEMLSGLAAGLIGLLALGIVLFAPLGTYASGGETCTADGRCTPLPEVRGHMSLFQEGIEPMAWFFLAVLAASLVVVAVSAALHSSSGNILWRVPLWAATMLILLFMLVAVSIGLFLVPAGLLALLAACLSLGTGAADPAQA